MKKNMEQLTLWMKTHKKKVAACMAVILLALGALGIGLAGMQKENQKSVVAKADQKKKVDEKQMKKTELKEEKTSKDDSKKEPEAKVTAKETTEVKTEEKQKVSQPDTFAPAHTHNYNIPIYTEQWVVDQAAWTETVSEPVYEMVPVMVCNDCGKYLDPSNCWEHIENHALNGGKGSWTDTWESQQTGTNTYTVPHPEQGHYESVVTGHQCSCGAVQ